MTESERFARLEKDRKIMRSLRLISALTDRWYIGLDAILGSFWPLGDIAMAVVALSPVVGAISLGLPSRKVARMLVNVGLDATIGGLPLPLISDILDIGFRANTINLEIIEEHLREIGHPEAIPKKVRGARK